MSPGLDTGVAKGVARGVAKGVFITAEVLCFSSTWTLCLGERISLNRRGSRQKAGSLRRLVCFLDRVVQTTRYSKGMGGRREGGWEK